MSRLSARIENINVSMTRDWAKLGSPIAGASASAVIASASGVHSPQTGAPCRGGAMTSETVIRAPLRLCPRNATADRGHHPEDHEARHLRQQGFAVSLGRPD